MSSYDATSQSMPWMSSTRSTGNTKYKINGTIVHPIFIKILEYVDDPYWRSILTDAVKGKFTKGLSFNGDTLVNKKDGRSIIIKEDKESINKVIDFIKNTTGMRSQMDLEREKDYEKERSSIINTNINSWSDVKTKFNKKLLIVEFISKMSKLYELTQDETNQLATIIYMYIDDDVIKRGILVRDNNISEIYGLCWDPIKRKFFLEVEPKKNVTSKMNPSNIRYVEEEIPRELGTVETVKNWNKLMKGFSKGIKKPSINSEEILSHPFKNSSENEYNYTRSSNS